MFSSPPGARFDRPSPKHAALSAPRVRTPALYAIDRQGRIVFCTDGFARLVGERPEDVVGKLSLTYFPADDAPSLLLLGLDALLRDGHSVVRTTHIRRSGETLVPVELSVMSFGGDGLASGHLVRATEVDGATAGKAQGSFDEARGALSEPHPVLEDLASLSPTEADALPYGLIVLDRQGIVRRYNDAESRLSGLDPRRVLGRSFFDRVAPCTRVTRLGELYRRMVETGEPTSVQLDFVFRFGNGERPVHIVMAYLDAMAQGVLLIDPR